MGFRSKLILSYAVVILVTLGLGVILFALIFSQIQQSVTDKNKQRLLSVTKEVSDDLARPPGGVTLTWYQSRLESYANLLNVRVLLVDSQGQVRVDTGAENGSTLLDQKINYKLVPRDNQAYQGSIVLQGVTYFYYARPGPNIGPIPSQLPSERITQPFNSQLGQAITQTDLLLSVPEETLSAGWNDFARGMLLAAALALAVSIALALLIARSISRPLTRMTEASVAIAHGRYNEHLRVDSRDEFGRLAMSFNQMAHEVARSQQTMRDFVANVSHELKTPLTSIQGFSQAIAEGVADDPELLKHSADVIYEEAARMRRLVDELLDLSRIESGQVELNRRELNLRGMLERVIIKLGPLADDKHLHIEHHLETLETPVVMGDADRLEQIFTNILDNAIKYSREYGTIWLQMQTGQPRSPEQTQSVESGRNGKSNRPNFISVTIGNTGPMIPPEKLPRIFERFYKLDPSRKRKGESTGLGLAIAKELVEAHQGSITVTSQPLPEGQGQPGDGYTFFTIRLPLVTNAITTPNSLNLLKEAGKKA
ncbi:MAG TPA: HAMP domain-containing sensor histidine kinase [Chloroflexia bacterium]|nr:HAMP domain-containing sensor histidine kinase [Chloroflexia bacterium]